MGSVLGQGFLGEYLVVPQGVSVGGDIKLRSPLLCDVVVLFLKFSLIDWVDIGQIVLLVQVCIFIVSLY